MLSMLTSLAFAQAFLPPRWDGQALLALVDADMTATAYADRRLVPIDDQGDRLVEITSDRLTHWPVSNTVMGWPGSMAVSSDGRYVYVVSSRAEVDRSIGRIDDPIFENFPMERRLTVVDREAPGVVTTREVCASPRSVDLAPSGDWLLIACVDAGSELMAIELEGAVFGREARLAVPVDAAAARAVDAGATFAKIAPDGRHVALVVGNQDAIIGELSFDDGFPASVDVIHRARDIGWISVMRWTADSQAALMTDVAWGPSPIGAVLNGPGALLSFDRSSGDITGAEVSRSPETFALNRQGDLAVTVNMERTYLPGGLLSLVPGRSASSLSLVAVKTDGSLETLGPPVKFRGVLPEAAVFDADGDRVAVAIYQDHGDLRSDGWISFFALEGEGEARRLVETGERITLSRGVHDLVAID